VQQLLRALTLLLDELARLPEAQPAKKAAAAGGAADGAAADGAKDEEAAARARSHGALPPHAVSAIRDALTKADVADKLPPAARKVGDQMNSCSCWHGASYAVRRMLSRLRLLILEGYLKGRANPSAL
jgi:hypothetical protein